MTGRPKVPFHAKVVVRSAGTATRDIDGRLGYVAGVSERPEADARHTYAVFVYDLSRVWCCGEAELEPTGELDQQQVVVADQHRRRLAAKGIV